MSLKDLQPIVPKANVEDYITTIYGKAKVGKTTLAFNIGKEHFGSTKETLILGFEDGFKALTGAMARSIDSWQDFLEVSEELIDEKEDLPFKVLVFDTIDKMASMASTYVARRESKADQKRYKTIKDIPWGRGGEALRVEIQNAIENLAKHYGVILITHEKDKKIEPKVGASYDTTTLSLDGKVLEVVKNISDFIVYLNVEREKGKDKAAKRYMYFRDESMFEAGSRFPKVKAKVPYGAKNFLDTVKEAVEHANGGIDSINETEAEETEAQSNEVEDQDVPSEEVVGVEELQQKLTETAKKLPQESKNKLRAHMKAEYDTNKFAEIDQISDLEAIQDFIDGL